MRTETTLLLYKSRLFGRNSDVSELSEFGYPKKKKKKKKKGKAQCSNNKMLGPYAMTSGRIFSRPALPLSQ